MQGFNMGRYYPPDASNPPAFNQSSHPLGARAKKINQGILTVRFELPFAVWCTTCKPEGIVGQGVRFNAEKKKVGAYHSTPIWSFRMKHTACGGWWEIRTDPQNSAYVVVSGARKRDYGPEDVTPAEKMGELAFLSEAERERRRNDAFASLEGKVEERGVQKVNKERVGELLEAAEVWRDPYTMNQKLRKEFRGKRKMAEREDRVRGDLQDKFSFGYEIEDEREIDRVRASMVEFGEKGSNGHAERRALFENKSVERAVEIRPKSGRLKSEMAAEKSRKHLQQTLVGNTKASIDPFLVDNGRSNFKANLGLLKRKRAEEKETDASDSAPTVEQAAAAVKTSERAPPIKAALPGLVDYDSD